MHAQSEIIRTLNYTASVLLLCIQLSIQVFLDIFTCMCLVGVRCKFVIKGQYLVIKLRE